MFVVWELCLVFSFLFANFGLFSLVACGGNQVELFPESSKIQNRRLVKVATSNLK